MFPCAANTLRAISYPTDFIFNLATLLLLGVPAPSPVFSNYNSDARNILESNGYNINMIG